MTVALVVMSVIQLILLVLVVGVIYQLLQQQGRILTHVESLEQSIPELGVDPMAADGRPRGIPPAMQIPTFSLPDLGGTLVTPQDLEGRRVLLVNWNTSCGFCEQIVEELGRLQPSLTKRNTDIVLVSRGEPQVNRESIEKRGLSCRVLLQPEGPDQIAAFARTGTPAAYLLDEHGRVAKPMSLGADEVLDLARAAAGRSLKLTTQRPLSESRIERNGLPAGTPAPPIELPTVAGEIMSLDAFRGSRVLLVLSDPECGPCEALAPHLSSWHRDHAHDGLTIFMVSRGDPDENRKKIEAYGIGFPVVIQPHWRVSTAYGTFAMPSAFLIDEQGVIETGVARGPEEILALANKAIGTKTEVRAG
jgi:peroxiredoxin